jgi:hypothetical protein
VSLLLQRTASQLQACGPGEAVAAIKRFLEGGRDVPTKLSFRIESGGYLSEAPTFRTWLLDQLGRIDPQAAAEMAQTILASPNSADEWAVAMRDFARNRTSVQDTAYLKGKLLQLLREPRWQQEQSTGWLEAFDVAVHTRATDVTPELARFVTLNGNRDRSVAHAAFLALDRLVLAEPATMLEQFQGQPDLLAGRELTRANYFARADVRDPLQRAVLEQYLLDERHQTAELQKFAGIYPSANFTISTNLLTSVVTPSQSQLLERDRAALAAVEQWLADERFRRLYPELRITRSRLMNFVEQAGIR